ncbi:GNAT family protein [Curtobacterium sp. MCSS17_007]|uniref:GNAT family N-acetyltransferase n=1 Tax=Curtobacterium sp. MCSS17_007 TaxID=2175646 RepID=UPI000DA803A0|nr:GNAT family protein [Curtobacterium sp. MCSS17_007]WIE75044.1 GNAT family protein [Curtobacterium sp. MCSS17_007]
MSAGTRIRPIELSDAAELAALVRASADHLRPFEPTRPDSYFTEAGQRATIGVLLAGAQNGGSVPFVIVGDDDELLGRITLSGVTRGALQSCALGYWIRADRTRQGHATRAVGLAVDHAFRELGLHRVQAETLPENTASQRALERNGFERYGFAPQYIRIAGAWRDHVMFQVLTPDA